MIGVVVALCAPVIVAVYDRTVGARVWADQGEAEEVGDVESEQEHND